MRQHCEIYYPTFNEQSSKSSFVEEHVGTVVTATTTKQLLQHVFVDQLNVVVVELYPSVADSRDGDIVPVFVALADMHNYAHQTVQVGLPLVVVVLR